MQSILKLVKKYLGGPEVFLQKDEARGKEIVKILKTIYDGVVKETEGTEERRVIDGAMPELMVNEFDTEQIWEQVQLLNGPMLEHFREKAQQIANGGTGADASGGDLDAEVEGDEEAESDAEDEDNLKEAGGGGGEGEEVKKQSQSQGDEELQEDNSEEGGESENNEKTPVSDGEGKREDIEFFDEDELDEIADFDFRDGDFQILERQKGLDDEDEDDTKNEDDDEELDMNAPLDEGDAANLRYDDFFDKPELTSINPKSKEEDEEVQEEAEGDNEEHLRKDGEDEGSDTQNLQGLSKYERYKLKMKRVIKDIETKIVQPREWVMSGEVSASKRPANSLLETDLDFQLAQRLPEPVTEETTLELEELIRQRIINEIWDDPERKDPPKEKAFKPKKEISNEKNELGLAELYEKEYVAKATGQGSDEEINEKLNKEHQEIAVLFAELNHKLDALSNFHFTPKPHIEELKVTTKTPAIAMEEVIPMAVSKEQTIAPQEEFKSKAQGLPTDRAEMTKKERQTMRNSKKKRFRKRKRAKDQREKVEAKTDSRKAAKLDYNKAKASKFVSTGHETDNVDYSKSSAMFAKIQASVDGKNVVSHSEGTRKKKKRGKKASHYKL
eukprot:CAMPEP_0114512512 /NCGR_PEP_ID=MMETSP0109-20121206/15019_1 /TAXON_ID=29199 /ORGANISM="Chlorarachnion reptans, Strain CCCM449" /LENGTH=614 /DNA_ID=CAMNT_0001692209 /DNA_START=288 /DNA_END=2132 /DNA_ORIENTATION=-